MRAAVLLAARSCRAAVLLLASSFLVGVVTAGSAFAVLVSTGTAIPLNDGLGSSPVVATLPDDGFVAVWRESLNGPESSTNPPACVVARLFDAEGIAIDLPFAVSTSTAACPVSALRVVSAADGTFVVAWLVSASPPIEIYVRRFDAGGTALGPATVVSNTPTQAIGGIELAMAADGRFALAWSDSFDLYARGFDADGTPAGDPFVVATLATCCLGIGFDVDLTPSGQLVALWAKRPTDQVLARRFALDGTAESAEFAVNAATSELVSDPAVLSTASGGFLAFWRDGTVYASRLFDAADVPQGNRTRLPVSGSSVTIERTGSGYVAFFYNYSPLLQHLDETGAATGDPFPIFRDRRDQPFGSALVSGLAVGTGDRIVLGANRPYLERYCQSDDASCDRCRGFDDAIDVDSDAIPDGCDLCINVAGTQNLDVKPKLYLTKGGAAKISKLRIRGDARLPVPFSTLAPDVDGVRVVIESAVNGAILDERLDGGPEWRAAGSGRKWTFKGELGPSSPTGGGTWKLSLIDRSAKSPGAVRIKIRHDRGAYALLPTREYLDVPPKITVLFGDDDAGPSGLCAETAFDSESCSLREQPFVSVKCR